MGGRRIDILGAEIGERCYIDVFGRGSLNFERPNHRGFMLKDSFLSFHFQLFRANPKGASERNHPDGNSY